MGLPTYFYLRNARPVRPIGVRLMVAGGMGMIGSFLGFTAGGVAAALEVNRRMENPEECVLLLCAIWRLPSFAIPAVYIGCDGILQREEEGKPD